MTLLRFPDSFLWGAATASYQIEGASTADGRGESIWDRFSHTPGKTANGDTGDIACDHYHRFREDVALMRDLGLKTYRFSIAWPRLFPLGSGPLNQPGADFYSRLVDALLEADILPVPTLYHWDLPQALQDQGGWPNRDTAYRFADYAEAAFRLLGDRVTRWITLNEPWCVAFLGYQSGEHAPGLQDRALCLQAGHTLLLAHGLAVERCRQAAPHAEIGITVNVSPAQPASSRAEDLEAAARYDAWMNRWFLDPIYRGEYPDALREAFGAELPVISGDEAAVISVPTDFLGVNYYSRTVVANQPAGDGLRIRTVPTPGAPVTEMGWEIYPDGLREILLHLNALYHPAAVYITENGAAFNDVLGENDAVDDEPRRVFLRDHFAAAHRAIQEGVPLRGYYVWSLMDNFEWAFGYTRRFGIVYCDYPTQRRIPKRSALWYSGVTASNAVDTEEDSK